MKKRFIMVVVVLCVALSLSGTEFGSAKSAAIALDLRRMQTVKPNSTLKVECSPDFVAVDDDSTIRLLTNGVVWIELGGSRMENFTFGGSGIYQFSLQVLNNGVVEDEIFADCAVVDQGAVVIQDSWTELSYGLFKDCDWLTAITIPDSVTNIVSTAFAGCTNVKNIIMPLNVTTRFPGFYEAEFQNLDAYSDDEDIRKSSKTVVRSADMLTVDTIAEHLMYGYAAYMWFESGVTYEFLAHYDDRSSVKADENWVIQVSSSDCQSQTGIVRFDEDGWRWIEIRAWNNGGYGAANFGECLGVKWRRNGEDWRQFADVGDGTLFCTKYPLDNGLSLVERKDVKVEGYPTTTGEWTQESEGTYRSNSIGHSKSTQMSVEIQIEEPRDYVFQWKVSSESNYDWLSYKVDGKSQSDRISGSKDWQSMTIPLSAGSHTIVWTYSKDYTGSSGSDCGWVRLGTAPTIQTVNVSRMVSFADLFPDSFATVKRVAIQNGGTKLPEGFFSSCTALETVTLPETLETIEASAFKGCASLASIDLPPSVTSIGADAFAGCENLKHVNVRSIADWLKISFANESSNPLSMGARLCVGGEEVTDLEISDGATEIGAYAFQGGKFSSVTIPDSVTNIALTAFAGCSNIVEANLECLMTSESKAQNLLHRWSFNGNLRDSIGGQAAKIVGSVKSDGRQYTLAGGSNGSSYIDLGSNILPNDGSGATLEIWGTQKSVKKCSRIWDIGGSKSTDMLMAWTRESDVNIDGICIRQIGDDITAKLSPYSLGTEFHIVVVFWPQEDGTWKVNYYKQDASTGTTLATTVVDTAGKSWSLLTQSQNDCWLGHSHWSGDNDANASYNEVRVWNCALTESELSENACLGPDVLPGDYSLRAIFPDSYAKIERVTLGSRAGIVHDQFLSGCESLKTLEISDDVKRIDAGAFDDCTALESVVFPTELEDFGLDLIPEAMRGSLGYDADGFMVKDGWLLDYKNKGASELVVPEGVVGIGHYALAYMEDLELVSLPSTLKYIASAAFVEDTYLDNLEIPDSVVYIGKGAFEDCSWIQTMTIGTGVKEIADRAFAGCSYLGVVTLPFGLESIGDEAFADCRKMPSVSIPVSVRHVASSAFAGCSALTGVMTPTSVAPLSGWFKPVYTQIRDVTVPAGETDICCNMFNGCSALVSVFMPEGVTNIADGAFMDCVNLPVVELPSTLRSIGADAFRNCDALTALGLPDAVERIGVRTFYDCAKLKDVSLSESLGELPDQVFDSCSVLDSVVVQAAVSNLGARAFGSAMTAVYYLGDAPSYDESVYAATPSRLITYVKDGSRGWDGIPQSRNLPRNWPVGNASARSIATWSPVRYDVAFDAGDGLFVSPVPARTYACEQTVGTVYSLPPYNPVRQGWKFDGWWTETSGGTRITPSTRVVLTKAHTLYAHWTQGCLVKVRFNANGGTVNPAEADYVAEVPYGEFPLPTREHFVFDGWFTEPQGGSVVRISMEAPKADRELFAHWSPAHYYIRFNANNGTRAFEMQDFTYGQTVTLRPNRFVCPSCTFAGWSLVPGGEAVYADRKTIENLAAVEDGVIDLYAAWSGDNYAVRFDSNGGQGRMENQTFVVGVSQPLLACSYMRNGYEFLGWAQSPSGQIRFRDGEEVEGLSSRQGEIVELFAVWGIAGMKTTVSFDPNGGTVGTTSVDCAPGEPFGELPVPVREGWAFVGWLDAGGVLVTSESIVPPGVVKLTASWGGGVRIVLWFKDGCRRMTFAAGHPFGRLPVLPPAQAPRPRYRFRGWAYDIAGMRLVSPTDTVPEEDLELYAVWVPEEDAEGDEPLVDYDEAGLVIWDGWLLGCEDKSAVAIAVPEGVVGIGQGALANMYDLQTVSLPSTLQVIAAGAFAYDTALDGVKIPDGVEIIGEDAFAHCTYLQTLTLGRGVKHVALGAFRDCAQLANAIFRDGLESVGAEAFASCWRMQSVSLPLSVTNVGETAFDDCESLTGVTVPTGVAPLSQWFKPIYKQIRDVTVPVGETEVCANMFKGCSALVSASLPEGVTNLADGAFWDCTSLPSVVLPSSLVALGADVFRNCDAMTAAGVPEGVERIGVRAFYDCYRLQDVALSAKLTELPDQVFDSCAALDSFVVPVAVTNLGARIFGNRLSAVYFVGNSPHYDDNVYASTKSGLITYVKNGTKGWEGRDKPTSRALPDTWPVENSYTRTLTTWEPVQYDVTFDAGEGLFPSVQTATYACRQTVGTAYALPPFNPTFKAHKFAGWWTAPVGGTQVTPSTGVKLQKEHTLYAHWAEGIVVAVRFNACGGTVDTEEQNYTAEVPFGSFPVPTREHYEFVGWFTERIGGALMKASTEVPMADCELFAHWTPRQYKIRFNANNGSGSVAYQDYVYGQTVTLHGNVFGCTGCQFAGWSLTPGGVAVYGECATLQEVAALQDGVFDLYAVWSGNVYVVRFDSHGGVGEMANQTFVIGVSMPLAHCAFTRNGYIFRGWSRLTTGSAAYGDMETVSDLTKVPNSAVTLFAVWERDPDAEWAFEDYLNCTNLTFTLGGDSPYWYGLKTSRADVAGMMQSGAIGDMQTNWIQTVVSGSGAIGFWWKASGEFEKSKKGVITRYDYAEFTIDGVSVEEIGDESDWTYVTIPVEGSGSHVLRWMYHKDESGSDGDDCAWLSEVSWKPTQVAEPIPELPENPTADDVQSALAGSADSQLLVHVTDAATYNAYREWALNVGAAEVKASPNAWVSFAVDSAALLEKVPTDEDLTIEEFKPTAAAGAFEFTVSVKDVDIGSDAAAENLKTIFGLEGTPSLGSAAFDPKNVTLEFGEPKDGKLKFMAKPNTDDSQSLPDSFFMKMRVR